MEHLGHSPLYQVVLLAVAVDGGSLRFASERLRGDEEVALAAVAHDGYALQWASEACRDARRVVLAAVSGGGTALQYASTRLRADLGGHVGYVQLWANSIEGRPVGCVCLGGRSL